MRQIKSCHEMFTNLIVRNYQLVLFSQFSANKSWFKKRNQLKPQIPRPTEVKMSTISTTKLPHLLWNKSCIIIPAVFAEAYDDGKVIKLLLVIRSEQVELSGQHRQTFLLRQDTNANEVTEKPQIDPQLAEVYRLKTKFTSIRLKTNLLQLD